MEGNFRIVQLADFEFVIEKEFISTVKHPWYTFKKPESVSQWRKVDEKGRIIDFCSLFNSKVAYEASTLEEAKDRLRQIRRYPIYYIA